MLLLRLIAASNLAATALCVTLACLGWIGLGVGAAARKAVEAFGVTWAGSQLTKAGAYDACRLKQSCMHAVKLLGRPLHEPAKPVPALALCRRPGQREQCCWRRSSTGA